MLASVVMLSLSLVDYFKVNVATPSGISVTDNAKAFTVIIDPGHGGEDGGATANGIVEKDINLLISHKLKSFFDISNVKCILTRYEDVMLGDNMAGVSRKRADLISRINVANSIDNGIFVSIHQNKFEIPKYKGLQVYYSKNNRNSLVLADIIRNNAIDNLDKNNKRECKEADYRILVLDKISCPAVLVECGFLSNEDEAKLLSTNEYQQKLSFIIYLSIIEFIQQME